MSDIETALYQQMKLTILLTTKNPGGSPFGAAYLYAWDNGIYPIFDGFADWHAPHASQFRVSEEQVTDLLRYMDQHWEGNETLTFYDLESFYDVRGTNPVWDRSALIGACRYIFLSRRFDQNFWSTLLENGKCPTEAHGIADEKPDAIYFM